MTIVVIYLFKVIDVYQGQREYVFGGLPLCITLIHLLIKGLAICKSGQPVGPSLCQVTGQLFGLRLEFAFCGFEPSLQLTVCL